MLLALSIFSVFFSHVIGFAGAGGLCTLVLAFLAALGWKTDKVTCIRSTLIWIKHLNEVLFMQLHHVCELFIAVKLFNLECLSLF